MTATRSARPLNPPPRKSRPRRQQRITKNNPRLHENSSTAVHPHMETHMDKKTLVDAMLTKNLDTATGLCCWHFCFVAN